jgi:hypothetical protein
MKSVEPRVQVRRGLFVEGLSSDVKRRSDSGLAVIESTITHNQS